MSTILIQLMPIIVVVLLGISIFHAIYSRKRSRKRYLYYSILDPILANLGFLLQFSGFLLVPAVIYAYYLQEFDGGVAISLSCTLFLLIGFILSFFFEPKMLNLKQSCILLVLYYTLVPLMSSIQFLYLGIFKGCLIDQFINSIFESSSAVSTTGFTLLKDVELPKSIVLARALIEWNGGIGIIFLLLSSFYPGLSLSSYGKALGIQRLGEDYKVSFMMVLIIYVIYTVLFSLLLALFGMDIFTAFHTALAVYSTTGLTIIDVRSLPIHIQVILSLIMLTAALSFSLHLRIFSLITNVDWRSLIQGRLERFFSSLIRSDWRSILTEEAKIHISLIAIFTIILYAATPISPFNSFLYVLSSSASVGLNIIDPDKIGETGRIILIIVMAIGASSFSVGGGIRVYRLYILGKLLKNLPRLFLSGENPRIRSGSRDLELSEIIINLLIVFLFVIFSIFSSLILCSMGYSFSDALFESISALSTTGNTLIGLTQAASNIHKSLLIVLMLSGRIEILPIFIAFSRVPGIEHSE